MGGRQVDDLAYASFTQADHMNAAAARGGTRVGATATAAFVGHWYRNTPIRPILPFASFFFVPPSIRYDVGGNTAARGIISTSEHGALGITNHAKIGTSEMNSFVPTGSCGLQSCISPCEFTKLSLPYLQLLQSLQTFLSQKLNNTTAIPSKLIQITGLLHPLCSDCSCVYRHRPPHEEALSAGDGVLALAAEKRLMEASAEYILLWFNT
ncbi:hypothetical protein GW17_00032677 [Ensete ventricosum]|nr:hypothetical protein GW17_00032677 [Ensete ventricosum]RZS27946.1 hypothetical protein BHM03_00061487 [Ensete ventricosum]